MNEQLKNNFDLLITQNAQNKEHWERLCFLLQNQETPGVFWVNCDTYFIKALLRDCLHEKLPNFVPYNIQLDQSFISLSAYLEQEKKDLPLNGIIHVFGLEDALKSPDFLHNLNFERESLFRNISCNLIFWADFDTGTLLMRQAYDFWSWVFFTFDFKTPEALLSGRQKNFAEALILQDRDIATPNKDSGARIRHLENEWREFLESVNGKPATEKQMKDAVTIALALVKEYRDDGKHQAAATLLNCLEGLNSELFDEEARIKVYNDLCIVYRELGKNEDALNFGVKALKIAMSKNDNPARIIVIRNNIGLVYFEMRDFRQAQALLESALENEIRIFGEDDQFIGTRQANLVVVYRATKNLDKARVLFESALKNNIRHWGQNHPSVNNNLSELALLFKIEGDYSKAKELLEDVTERDIVNYGKEHSNYAIDLINLAAVYDDLGDLRKAASMIEEFLKVCLNIFGEFHNKTAIGYSKLAIYSLRLNDKIRAKFNAQKAYGICLQIFGEAHPKTIEALQFLKKIE